MSCFLQTNPLGIGFILASLDGHPGFHIGLPSLYASRLVSAGFILETSATVDSYIYIPELFTQYTDGLLTLSLPKDVRVACFTGILFLHSYTNRGKF